MSCVDLCLDSTSSVQMAALAHQTAADDATKFVTGGSQLLGPLLAAVRTHQDHTLVPPQGDLMLALKQTRESYWKTTKRSRQQRDAFSLRRTASAGASQALAFSVSPAAQSVTRLNNRSTGSAGSSQQGGEAAASSNICWNFSLALQSSLL